MNERGKVMDVHGNRDEENRDIIVWKKHGGLNQQFDIIYKDQYPRDPTKGQLNKDFGLVVERDFFIISTMRSGRYIEVVDSRNLVIKTRNGRNTQRFWFDQRSLTIKSRQHNQSIEMQNNGRHANLRIWSTNSGWWQIFQYQGQFFTNIQNKKVFDVSGNRDQEG
jgi:hypothetical protein